MIILSSFVLAIYFYPFLPEQVASHWSAQGEVDGYMSKCWGLFLMPIISLAVFLLFLVIPKIDPLKKNIEKFRKEFDKFIVIIVLFLFYIYILTLVWNLGWEFDMSRMIIPALGLLFYFVGDVVGKAKRNWFVGIRTPWTLSSDRVWDKTHKIGGKLFKIIGIVALLGFFVPKYAIYIILIPVLVAAIFLVLYSYFEYRKE